LDKALSHAKKAAACGTPGSAASHAQYLIVKGNGFLFKKKYGKAVPFYSEALQISRDDGTSSSICINMCQMLGLCYRKTGDTDLARDFLVQGWEMIESTADTETIRTREVLCCYALEFGKVLHGDEMRRYESRFEEIWGENWRDKIMRRHKDNRKAFRALSIKNRYG
jgi:hypothetical protein